MMEYVDCQLVCAVSMATSFVVMVTVGSYSPSPPSPFTLTHTHTHTQKRYSSQKTNTIWLAVHEDGLSLLERNTMESLASYSYSEVSTFGSHGNDFMLVVSPRQDGSSTTGNLVEKLLLAMPQVKVRNLVPWPHPAVLKS